MTDLLRYRRSPHVVARRILDEELLVPIRGALADMQRVFALNSVGAHIWQVLEHPHTEAEIAAALVDRFAVEEPTAMADTEVFIRVLLEAGLVEAETVG